MTGSSILVVDDDSGSAEYLRLALERDGHRVRVAGNGLEALQALEAQATDLLLSDLRMPHLDGSGLLSRVRQRWPGLPVIMVTVEQDLATVVEMVQRGAANYLVKPLHPETLRRAVGRALEASRLEPAPPAVPGDIIGGSPCMVEVRRLVGLAARSEVNVLLWGETGTGKELVARAIHRLSPRGGRAFMAHNCAVVGQELFDSEFFGHVRGAFTGADRDHAGLLEQADGGVLLLDELEALSPVNQAKLLRVMDDGEVRRLGSSQTRRISVRFIAATNLSPRRMLDEGHLRADLYYRLRGYEIHLPPLRERPEDIPLLGAHFLGEQAHRLTPDVAAALARHPWPGNVRELRSRLDVLRARPGAGPIRVGDLDLPGTLPALPSSGEAATPPREAITLKEMERRALLEALERNQGNRTHAARVLGIDRSTLRRKMDEFGIS